MKGKVYLVGAGPGDPGLVTVRGVAVLGLADIVLYDALAHPALLQHARKGAELRHVGKRYGEESFSQEAINAELVRLAREGKVVARLKGGDPLLFARGAEEAETLAEAGIPYEIVPGIPSPTGAAAYAGISLTHRDLSSSVAFITGTESPGKERTSHDWSKLATATQTLCVIMGMKRLGEITSALIEHGRDPRTPAAVVQWGTWSRQRVVEGTVENIAERVAAAHIANPAVVVIGQVASLREKLKWFDRQPLFGRRIVVTRPAHQSEDMARQLRAKGADAVVVPAITIAPPPEPERLRAALDVLGSYDLVAFTSANGVDRTFDGLTALRRDARAFGGALVAAIGPGTESALARHAIVADVVAAEFRGEGLATAILAELAKRPAPAGKRPRVLILRALTARDALPEALRAAAVDVDIVPAYETKPAPIEAVQELARELEARTIDAVTFTSGSTVKETIEALSPRAIELLAGTTLAAIGPVTAEVARAEGLTVDVVASEYTVAGLIDALERHFATRPHP